MRIRRLGRFSTAAMVVVALLGTGALVAAGPVAVRPVGASAENSLQGRGSVDEAWLTGAHPGDRIVLMRNGSRGGRDR